MAFELLQSILYINNILKSQTLIVEYEQTNYLRMFGGRRASCFYQVNDLSYMHISGMRLGRRLWTKKPP